MADVHVRFILAESEKMKKRFVCIILLILLTFSTFAVAYAATSIPKPPWCPKCGTTSIVKIGTMWTTSNPPQIYYEVWRCTNGHEFKNWPNDCVPVSVDDLVYIAE